MLYVEDRCCIQRGWVGGDDNVHCIVSSEDVVTLKIVLAYRWGGVWGDVHCIASSENVVTLNMLLRSICCYVQDVVMLKMLLCSRCCYVEDVVMLKMLLRWRCCYVEDVITNAFKTALWMWREKRLMCISPMVLWWIMTFLCLSKETWNSQRHAIPMWKAKNDLSWWTWKRPNNIETGDKISQICCPHVELIPDILTSSEEHKTL